MVTPLTLRVTELHEKKQLLIGALLFQQKIVDYVIIFVKAVQCAQGYSWNQKVFHRAAWLRTLPH